MEQNQTYRVDTVYYTQKYGLEFLNQREAIEHFLKIGKQKGYFPNRCMETYYQKTLNFDPDYYRRKYLLTCNKDGARKHWEDHGIKHNHFVNICEETNTHQPLICKCKYIAKKESLMINNQQHNNRDNVDGDTYVFIKKHTNDYQKESIQNQDYQDQDQGQSQDQSQGQSQDQSQGHSQGQSQDQSLGQSQGQDQKHQGRDQAIKESYPMIDTFVLLNKQIGKSSNKKKRSSKSKVLYDSKSMTHNHRLKLKKNIDKQTFGPSLKKQLIGTSNKYNLNISVKPNNQNHNNHNCSNDDVKKQTHKNDLANDFESNYIDCGYRVMLKTIDIEVPILKETSSLPNVQPTTMEPIDQNAINQKLFEQSSVESTERSIEQSTERSTENNLAMIHQNILNIKSHINMSNICSDTYESIIKEAYQSIKDVDPGSYHVSYVKLLTMLKDADNMIQHSQHNKFPIFCKVDKTVEGIRSPTNIKYPLLMTGDDRYNQTLVDSFGKENIYFKIPLMKISLDHIGLRKYLSKKFTQINEHNKMTVKKSLEDAMIIISTEKELMHSHLKRIEIKESMILKVIALC